MALPGVLAAILGGLGTGVGAAGQAVGAARRDADDKARQASRDALLERQVVLQEQNAANERSDRETLATTMAGDPTLGQYAPLARTKGGLDVVKMLADLNAKKAALDAERGERADLTRFVARADGTPDTIQRGGALDLNANPEAAGTDALVPGQKPLDRTQRLAGLAAFKNVSPELYKRLTPEEPKDAFMAAGPEQDILNRRTGEVIRKGTPKPAEPKEGKTLEERGARARMAYRQNPTPQTRAALDEAEEAILVAKEIARARGEGAVAGRPVSIEAANAVAASAGAKKAAGAALAAVDDPIVQQYLGPYAQYLSEGQRRTPFQLAGDVPPAVIELEQNTAKVKNYLIKLISGAAVRKDEEPRIIAEAVDLRYPPNEYRQRMAKTLEMIAEYEQVVRDLALRGDQKALAVASELGLLGGPNGKGGVNLSAPVDTTPQTTPQTQPPAAPKATKRFNPATGKIEPVR